MHVRRVWRAPKRWLRLLHRAAQVTVTGGSHLKSDCHLDLDLGD
jgi:hypothetical protein